MDAKQRRLKLIMRWSSRSTVPLYRLLGGRFAAKMSPKTAPPVFLLTTTGRRTGKSRTVALSYITDEDGIIVVGSNGGLPTDPAWAANLRTNAQAVVQIGRKKTPLSARFVAGEEADRLRERISADWPDSYGMVFRTTERAIPIIRLESPVAAAARDTVPGIAAP